MAERDVTTQTISLLHDSRRDKTPSPLFLCVDETKRPRANSDPVGLHIHISNVPEITVTGDDCRSGEGDDDGDSFLIPPSPRRRANTCPEDMFCTRKGRPPTPPPTDIRILRNPAGKRFSFNFNPKDTSSMSFAHHRLSKVSEEKADQQQKAAASQKLGGYTKCNDGNCPSPSLKKTNDDCTHKKNDFCCRLQTNPGDPAIHTAEQCDQCVDIQVRDLSVEDTNNSEVSKKKALVDRVGNTDVLTNSPDSWRSKDNSRDNLDSKRLAAY